MYTSTYGYVDGIGGAAAVQSVAKALAAKNAKKVPVKAAVAKPAAAKPAFSLSDVLKTGTQIVTAIKGGVDTYRAANPVAIKSTVPTTSPATRPTTVPATRPTTSPAAGGVASLLSNPTYLIGGGLLLVLLMRRRR